MQSRRTSQADTGQRRPFHAFGITAWAQRSFRVALGFCNATQMEPHLFPQVTSGMGFSNPSASLLNFFSAGTLEAVIETGRYGIRPPGPNEAASSN